MFSHFHIQLATQHKVNSSKKTEQRDMLIPIDVDDFSWSGALHRSHEVWGFVLYKVFSPRGNLRVWHIFYRLSYFALVNKRTLQLKRVLFSEMKLADFISPESTGFLFTTLANKISLFHHTFIFWYGSRRSVETSWLYYCSKVYV